jgi:hypothetical protein
MWLPTPLYESLPAAYVIIGLLMLGGVIYVGFDGPLQYCYAGLGVIAVLAGFTVSKRRNLARQSRTKQLGPD